MHDYRASLIRVVDGDTIDVLVLQGFRMSSTQRLRLAGINAPELHAGDPLVRAKAQAARSALEVMLLGPPTIVVQTKRDAAAGQNDDPQEKFGRYLADVFVDQPDGTRRHVNSDMIEQGHAVPFMVLLQLESD